jgi:hypothetical protein
MKFVSKSVNSEYDRLFPFKLQSYCGYETTGRSLNAAVATPLPKALGR